VRAPSLRSPSGAALVLALSVASALAGCATAEVKATLGADDSIAGLPRFPANDDALRAWVAGAGAARDVSVDLRGELAYAETPLRGRVDVSRVGVFVARAPHRVVGALFFLHPTRGAPALSTAATPLQPLWGLERSPTSTPRTSYVRALHALVVEYDDAVALPTTSPSPPSLPRDVPLKTTTRTFYRDTLFAVHDGRLWFKRNPARDGHLDEPWRLLGDNGLPMPRAGATFEASPKAITSITADGDDLAAVDDDGWLWLLTSQSESLTSQDGWQATWGFPGGRRMNVLEGRGRGRRALAIGRRAEHALYFEDPIGNRHSYKPMGTSTLYALDERGQSLLFSDNGLPNDFSRELCSPDDGRLEAIALSASASAVMLLDRFGRIVTRFDDYDVNGGTPNFEYTYRSVIEPDDTGDELGSAFRPYHLPLLPWRWQPPVPLAAGDALSTTITILQTGEGNAARVLRVGARVGGQLGMFTKGIDDDAWQFVAIDEADLPPLTFLDAADVARGARAFVDAGGELERSTLPRAKNHRATWSGSLAMSESAAPEQLTHVAVRANWQPSCPPMALTFDVGEGMSFTATLHTVDLWTPAKRRRPGMDGTPLLLLGTLVLPDEVLRDQRKSVRAVVAQLRRYHHGTLRLLVAQTDDRAAVVSADDDDVHSFVLDLRRDEQTYDPPERPPWYGRLPATMPRGRAERVFARIDAPELTLKDGASDDERAAVIDRLEQARVELRAAHTATRAERAEVEAFIDELGVVGAAIVQVPGLRFGQLPVLKRLLEMQIRKGARSELADVDAFEITDAALARRIAAYRANRQ